MNNTQRIKSYIMHDDNIIEYEGEYEEVKKQVYSYWYWLPLTDKLKVNQCWYTYDKDGMARASEWGVQYWKNALHVLEKLRKYLGSSGSAEMYMHEPNAIRVECAVPNKRRGIVGVAYKCGYQINVGLNPSQQSVVIIRVFS